MTIIWTVRPSSIFLLPMTESFVRMSLFLLRLSRLMENVRYCRVFSSHHVILHQLTCWCLPYLVIDSLLFVFNALILLLIASALQTYSSYLFYETSALFRWLVLNVVRIVEEDWIVDARSVFLEFVYLLLILLTFFSKVAFLRFVWTFYHPIIWKIWLLLKNIHLFQLEIVSSMSFVGFLTFCCCIRMVWRFCHIEVIYVIDADNFLWFWTELNGTFGLWWHTWLRNIIHCLEVIENVVFTLHCFWIELLNMIVNRILLLDIKHTQPFHYCYH